MTSHKLSDSALNIILTRQLGNDFTHASDGPLPKSDQAMESYERNGNRLYGPPHATESQSLEERIQRGFAGIYVRKEPAIA